MKVGDKITIFLDEHSEDGKRTGKRTEQEVTVFGVNEKSVKVALPNGRMILRKLGRDIKE